MPGFSTEVPHQLGKDEALARLKSFMENVAEKYRDQLSNMQGEWTDNVLNFSFSTFGLKIDGQLTVHEDRAKLDGQIPFAAVAFKGKIEGGIAGELKKALA